MNQQLSSSNTYDHKMLRTRAVCRGTVLRKQLYIFPFLVSLSKMLYSVLVRLRTDGLLQALCTVLVKDKFHLGDKPQNVGDKPH